MIFFSVIVAILVGWLVLRFISGIIPDFRSNFPVWLATYWITGLVSALLTSSIIWEFFIKAI